MWAEGSVPRQLITKTNEVKTNLALIAAVSVKTSNLTSVEYFSMSLPDKYIFKKKKEEKNVVFVQNYWGTEC